MNKGGSMNGINTVFLLGRLGKEVQTYNTPTGKLYADLRIATNRKIRQNNDWVEITDWHQIRFWGKQAEICQQYLHKGSLLAIQGSIRTDSWMNDEGETQYKTYIHGSQIHLLPTHRSTQSKLLPLSST
jgi:single-strand DNA-binding protein